MSVPTSEGKFSDAGSGMSDADAPARLAAAKEETERQNNQNLDTQAQAYSTSEAELNKEDKTSDLGGRNGAGGSVAGGSVGCRNV